MSLHNAKPRQICDTDWRQICRRNSAPSLEEWQQGQDFRLSNALGFTSNRTRRRLDITNWVCGIIVAVLLAAAVIGSL